jgi:transposase
VTTRGDDPECSDNTAGDSKFPRFLPLSASIGRFSRFRENGVINAAERAIRALALGRKNWLFASSDTGGERAMIYTTIETTKPNGLDPYAYLADLFGRIGEHPINRIADLLPGNWQPAQPQAQAA